ncbi:MAG: ABC transporter permease [Bacteroidota bacterium]
MRIVALVLKRLAWFAPTLVGLLLVVFIISHIIPANPAIMLAGEGASEAQINEIKRKFGLDQPLPVQFWRYLQSVVQGDMGTSLYTQRPIAEDLLTRVPATLELTLITIVIAAVLGIPLGVIAATRRNSMLDHVLRIFTVSGLAIASFWLAILFQLMFAMKLGWTPLQGRVDGWGPDHVTGFFLIDALIQGDGEILSNVASHLVLPVATLAFPAMATIVRFTRAGVLDAINSNYVLYEQAMGLPRHVIIWKYVLRNALIGTVTQIGLIFGILLAGAVVVESVFDWPGLGLYAVNSIMRSDYNGTMGFTLITGAIFIVVNLFVDIVHGIIDPRGAG